MNKLFALVGVVAGAFTLSGCELNNTEMKDVISKCKEDTECKAILDREIDEALAERGIFGNDSEDMDYEVFYDLDLTDEEKALFETLEKLDEEVFAKLENMTDEEIEALEIQEFENMLGRELTSEELADLDLVEELWMNEDSSDFDSEIEYLEFYLGRTLSDEEKAAFDLIDNLYMSVDEMTEIQELELMLERQLTTEELSAFETLDSINWEDFDDESDLPKEVTDAFDLIDQLYEEAYQNTEELELTLMLGRELTDEEKSAIETVNNLYLEMEENYDFDFEDDDAFVTEQVAFYETILGRELTNQEKEAIEFSLEFYFYEDDFYFDDDMYYDDEEYDDDIFDVVEEWFE